VVKNPLEIEPQELRRRLDAGESIRVIDVREPWEYQVCRLDGAELIPMGDVPTALPRLDGEESPLVVYCHHGIRSLRVADWLRQQGVEQVWSLAGGIDRWSAEIDPAVPRYL
jgi:rhodanese-related sulfurtransferase